MADSQPESTPPTTAAEHRVVFVPSGLTAPVADGTTVLEAAARLGADLDTVCGGRAICGRCQVLATPGEFAKWAITVDADALSPWSTAEENYRGRRPIEPGHRLGCSARIHGDVVIDIPPQSQIHRPIIRKSVDVGDLVIDPIFSLHYLTLDQAGALSPAELTAALADQWGIDTDPSADPAVLAPAALVEPDAQGGLTVARRDGRIVAAWPGFVDQVFGIGVDIGSTTLAGHLVELTGGEIVATAGRMNPQIRFGEDLMSRVSYAMMNADGAAEMTAAVQAVLGDIAGELIANAQVDADRVLDITLVGNPIMHHLALGLDPTPLGQAPFPLAIEGAHHTTAADLDIAVGGSPAAATVYVAPCIAGHVGADTAAAILNEGPHRGQAVQLLVDVGTNAEIVLGNQDRLFACSSPTGPAFEGAQISSGQRATAGAIERVRIDAETLEPRFSIIGVDEWSDQEGFDLAVAKTPITGICGSGIIEVISEMVSAGIIDHAGLIRGDMAARTDRIVADGRTFNYVLVDGSTRIEVTQGDVRAIQLAKAALKAGIDLLVEHAEIETIDEIRLAGAFGAHIDPIHAITIGLIPGIDPERVRAVGNAAGAGAVRMLLSAAQRGEVEAVVDQVTKIETATEPRFQDLFVAALGFEHSTAPARATDSGPGEGPAHRRRSRRRARNNQETP